MMEYQPKEKIITHFFCWIDIRTRNEWRILRVLLIAVPTCNRSLINHRALIWFWDHLKNFIAEIPQGPLGMSIGTIWVTQKRFQGAPARGF